MTREILYPCYDVTIIILIKILLIKYTHMTCIYYTNICIRSLTNKHIIH